MATFGDMVESLATRHAFISYVREDIERVARLRRFLEAAEIPVWFDTENLWPGQDWRLEIKRAIKSGSLAFLACFSSNSAGRTTTYQNEELVLAVEQMRLRPPGAPWLIPVRFDDCPMPEYDLGAGRTLDSVQRVDLFDGAWEENGARLLTSIQRIFADGAINTQSAMEIIASQSPENKGPTLARTVKAMLHDPERQIELDDLLMSEASTVAKQLRDTTRFPWDTDQLAGGHAAAVEYILARINEYWAIVSPLAHALTVGCAYGQPVHDQVWSRIIRTVANAGSELASGKTVLLQLRRYPLLPLLYAAGAGSLSRNNYHSLKAVTTDPVVQRATDGARIPVIGAMHVWRPFADYETPAHVLAFRDDGEDLSSEGIEHLAAGRRSRRHTPVSDHLHRRLQPLLMDLVPDQLEYDELFDQTEAFLGLIAADAKVTLEARSQVWIDGPWPGRFLWRQPRSGIPLAREIVDLETLGARWPPLEAGLFGADPHRAETAVRTYTEDIAVMRRNMRP